MFQRISLILVVCLHVGCATSSSYDVKPVRDTHDPDQYAFTVYYPPYSSSYTVSKQAEKQIRNFISESEYSDFEVIDVTRWPVGKALYRVKFYKAVRTPSP